MIEIDSHQWVSATKNIFHMTIHIEGNIDDAQRKRMLQIGKACPIHKVLTNQIEVSAQLI